MKCQFQFFFFHFLRFVKVYSLYKQREYDHYEKTERRLHKCNNVLQRINVSLKKEKKRKSQADRRGNQELSTLQTGLKVKTFKKIIREQELCLTCWHSLKKEKRKKEKKIKPPVVLVTKHI